MLGFICTMKSILANIMILPKVFSTYQTPDPSAYDKNAEMK